MRQRAYRIIALTGLLALAGAAQVAGCNDSLDDISVSGKCPPNLDDANPCTTDSCSAEGQVVHSNIADGTACALGSNAGKCQAGGCALDCAMNNPPDCACATVTDCPGPADECESWTCANETCERNYPQGNPIAMQIPGDCKDIVCDGSGTTEEAINNMDIPAQTDCKIKTCDMGVIISGNESTGTACQSGVCDGMGNCVQCVTDSDCGTYPMYCHDTVCHSCESGTQDGDEPGVDCGGHFCGACSGESCTAPTDCASYHCVDAVCCKEACDQACHSCNTTGMLGFCLPDPQYTADCTFGQLCNAIGECKLQAGLPCIGASDCAGGSCANGMCVYPVDAPCMAANQCITKFCDSFKCAPCQNDGDCPNGLSCNTTTGICG